MKGKYVWIFLYAVVIVSTLLLIVGGDHSITVISQTLPIPREQCFVIDPGHGGMDGGATSCSGILESHLNLEIALRLNDLLQLLGYETKMLRTEDTSIHTGGDTIAQVKFSDLKERVRIINETENAILLSIHQNYFSQPQYSGAQVFYARTTGSQALAEQLQSAFLKHLNPGSKRQCKLSKGIYLMEHIHSPGVLIECGFLSNPQEEALLRSSEYQKKLCAVIAVSVNGFVSNT